MVYDFCESRAGEHARAFLGDWSGGLVCDDFSGYKASFGGAITEVGCMAHARRKFFDLHVSNKSEIAQQALSYIGQLYEVEREVKPLSADERGRIRQTKSKTAAGLATPTKIGPRHKTAVTNKGEASPENPTDLDLSTAS